MKKFESLRNAIVGMTAGDYTIKDTLDADGNSVSYKDDHYYFPIEAIMNCFGVHIYTVINIGIRKEIYDKTRKFKRDNIKVVNNKGNLFIEEVGVGECTLNKI